MGHGRAIRHESSPTLRANPRPQATVTSSGTRRGTRPSQHPTNRLAGRARCPGGPVRAPRVPVVTVTWVIIGHLRPLLAHITGSAFAHVNPLIGRPPRATPTKTNECICGCRQPALLTQVAPRPKGAVGAALIHDHDSTAHVYDSQHRPTSPSSQPRVKGSRAWPDSSTQMALVSVYSRMASAPFSRPMPLAPKPPKGTCGPTTR